LAQLAIQQEMVEKTFKQQPLHMPGLGSTGSRLLTGNLEYAQILEKHLAIWHKRPAALLVNSGYDANLSVLSCLTLNSQVIMDALCHNSLQMGVRLSRGARVRNFRHNNVDDLENILTSRDANLPSLIVIESVYSMDGDMAPLNQIFDIALKYKACVIVDEAHALGVFGANGMGLLAELGLESHPSLLCSVHTFGKAAGCHGAVICSSQPVKDFLFNYGRPIIYSTALPLHSLVTIGCSYESMRGNLGNQLREKVHDRVQYFRELMSNVMAESKEAIRMVPSVSPIQALVIPGNLECSEFCQIILAKSNHRIHLFPIRSPTVPSGAERVRIIIHAHNSREEISKLVGLLWSTLEEMNLLRENHSTRNLYDNARSRL
jgi:8-amino-7-oxononanoate synthase